MKKRKGMTLMEVVISIAIYGILALLVTEIMTSVNATMRATNQLNDRMSYEAKFADNNQTNDPTGTPFPRKQITYSINYNDGGEEKTVGDTSREALEYTMDYNDDTIVGTNFAENVNFRFMSFDKVSLEPSEFPGDTFSIYVRFVPYFSDEIPDSLEDQKAKIRSAREKLTTVGQIDAILQGATSYYGMTEKKQTKTGPLAETDLGTDWILDIVNTADTLPADVNSLSAKLKFESTRAPFSDGVQRAWTDNEVEIYLYVKVSKDTLSATYYNRCLVEFDVNQGFIKPWKSLTADDTLPAPTDYAAILAS